jgi:hypothetical protein
MRLLPWRRKRTPASPGALINLDDSSTMMIAGRKRVLGLPYPNPADMAETNRLDFQHFMLRYAFQGLYAAPISQPTSMLDVGTGTGRSLSLTLFRTGARRPILWGLCGRADTC